MAFRFSLQRVLDLKSNQKSQAEWMLARALARKQEEEQMLDRLELERRKLRERLDHSAQMPIPAGELAELGRYIDHLDGMINRKRADVDRARKAVDDSRQHLLDRSIDEKVWLKAREKAFERYRAFVLKKEQSDIDEMASMRAESN
jgi:flagellar FliJ protein